MNAVVLEHVSVAELSGSVERGAFSLRHHVTGDRVSHFKLESAD